MKKHTTQLNMPLKCKGNENLMLKPFKAGTYRLSPNEIERLISEERKKRKLQRLKEVSEVS